LTARAELLRLVTFKVLFNPVPVIFFGSQFSQIPDRQPFVRNIPHVIAGRLFARADPLVESSNHRETETPIRSTPPLVQ
jgi:hypothetical protein